MNTRTCIVTGARRGICATIAWAFARAGTTLVATNKVEGSAAEGVRKIGGPHMRPDVASEEDWAALAEAWPTRDVPVNKAGIPGLQAPLAGPAHSDAGP